MQPIRPVLIVGLRVILLVKPLPGVVVVLHGLGLQGDVGHDALVLPLVDHVHDEGQEEAEGDHARAHDVHRVNVSLVL